MRFICLFIVMLIIAPSDSNALMTERQQCHDECMEEEESQHFILMRRNHLCSKACAAITDLENGIDYQKYKLLSRKVQHFNARSTEHHKSRAKRTVCFQGCMLQNFDADHCDKFCDKLAYDCAIECTNGETYNRKSCFEQCATDDPSLDSYYE